MTLHSAIQEQVESILSADTQSIVKCGSPQLKELLDKTCDLFEQYHPADQVVTCAFILGMLWAGMTGMTSEFELKHKILLEMKDRRALLDAMIEVVYREAQAAKAHPDCPKPTPM